MYGTPRGTPRGPLVSLRNVPRQIRILGEFGAPFSGSAKRDLHGVFFYLEVRAVPAKIQDVQMTEVDTTRHPRLDDRGVLVPAYQSQPRVGLF